MLIKYFKRYKMEIRLDNWTPVFTDLPVGYEFAPWTASMCDIHGQTIYECFRQSIDARYFITFTQLSRCRQFMKDLSSRPNFLEETTWLILYRGAASVDSPAPTTSLDKILNMGRSIESAKSTSTLTWHGAEVAGTIQGILRSDFSGGIQNVGITTSHRGKGLSKILLTKSLKGFQNTGLNTVDLEVTAENAQAIRLYQKMGFRVREIVNKAATVL